MTTLDDIWASYEDFELAFALHYKGQALSPHDKQALYSEIARRGLTSVGLRVLINEKLGSEIEGYEMTRCPRCTSYNIGLFHVEELSNEKNELVIQVGAPIYVEHHICQVCDYNVSTHLSQKKRQRNQKLSIALVLVMMLVMLLIVLL